MKKAIPIDSLVGRTVLALRVGDGEGALALAMEDGGALYLVAEGDCCSECWFSDVLNVDALLGSSVRSIVEREGRDLGHESRQESDNFYGLDIHTNKGTCQIEFRNSSNGYYGGSVELFDVAPVAWERREFVPMKWRAITGDWTA
jgi:hypothetical protein